MADPDINPQLARQPPTFQRALVSGAISGVAVDFLLFPLDTIKTRIQSSQGFLKAGGFSGVYRGVGSVGLGSAPGASAFFVTYESLKAKLPQWSSFLHANHGANHLVSASGAEFMSCLIRVPTEVVKSRTQTGAYGQGKSSMHSAIMTARYEGIRGFYRGFGITMARELPFTSIQFPLYEGLKTYWSRTRLGGRRPSPGEAAICGSIAGAVASILTTPLDVVKTRVMLEIGAGAAASPALQASGKPVTLPSPSVLSFPPRLLRIAREEGVSALFRGWQPRTFAIALGGAVFLGIYDAVVNWGKANKPDPELAPGSGVR